MKLLWKWDFRKHTRTDRNTERDEGLGSDRIINTNIRTAERQRCLYEGNITRRNVSTGARKGHTSSLHSFSSFCKRRLITSLERITQLQTCGSLWWTTEASSILYKQKEIWTTNSKIKGLMSFSKALFLDRDGKLHEGKERCERDNRNAQRNKLHFFHFAMWDATLLITRIIGYWVQWQTHRSLLWRSHVQNDLKPPGSAPTMCHYVNLTRDNTDNRLSSVTGTRKTHWSCFNLHLVNWSSDPVRTLLSKNIKNPGGQSEELNWTELTVKEKHCSVLTTQSISQLTHTHIQ